VSSANATSTRGLRGDCLEHLREGVSPRVKAVGADVVAAGGAERGSALAVGGEVAQRVRQATGSRSATIRPLRPSRTSPPAAAPTASLAMIAAPWFMASLTTSAHGSMNRCVRMEGTTRTSHAA